MKDCVSLEVAQKLQKAGYKSECEYYWHETEDPRTGYRDNYIRKRTDLKHDPLSDYDTDGAFESIYPAPTATQLAEELAGGIRLWKASHGKWISLFTLLEKHNGKIEVEESADTLPDALGLMMCYLLENKLI